MATSTRLAVQVANPRAVLHVPGVLVRLVRRTAGSPAALGDLQELVHAEREALEIRHDLAVIDERRGRTVPQDLTGVRRIRIDEEVVAEIAPRDAGAIYMDAQRLCFSKTVPNPKSKMLHVGVIFGRAHGIGERRIRS